MAHKIHSFSAEPGFEENIERIMVTHGLTKSAAIRFAVLQTIDKEDSMNTQTSLIMKTEELVGKFYDNATNQPSSQWAVVKAQASEMLKNYAGVLHPTLSPEAAVAKVSHEPDAIVKALYKLSNLRSDDHFSILKSQLRAAGGI